ncbi:MAG: bifunctional sugar-1-phosphate nucleotidylyltransferase/acetyltransferase [archaeon]
MKAVILAAGKSTRTHPLTATRPKALLPVLNKPILEHNLDNLQGLADEVVIVIGYLGNKIQESLRSYRGIKISYAVQEKQLGTGDALMRAGDFVKGKTLVMNGDDLYSREDIRACLGQYSILAVEVDDVSQFGAIEKKGGSLAQIREKSCSGRGIVNAGLYLIDESILKTPLKTKRHEYELTDMVSAFAGLKDVKVIVSGGWHPIVYPWSLLDATESLIQGIRGSSDGVLEKNATVKGEVIFGEGTIVKSGAYIEGPVIIGRDCRIGPNCYIRPGTVIGNSCKVGNAVEIKNSILFDNVSVGHLSYVGDSVLGQGANLGAGTVTANLRHDNGNVHSIVKGRLTDSGRRKLGTMMGDGVHTGINTSIYPGRKIWPGQSTTPGAIVKEDITCAE